MWSTARPRPWTCEPSSRTTRALRAFLDGAGPAAIGAIIGAAVPLAAGLDEPWMVAVAIVAAVALALDPTNPEALAMRADWDAHPMPPPTPEQLAALARYAREYDVITTLPNLALLYGALIGAVIALYLLTQNLRFVSVGLLLVIAGYALEFVGLWKEVPRTPSVPGSKPCARLREDKPTPRLRPGAPTPPRS